MCGKGTSFGKQGRRKHCVNAVYGAFKCPRALKHGLRVDISLTMETQDSGKRAIRMTEKGMEGHKARQVQASRYKLSQFTTTVKQTEQLMEDGANVNIVTDKLRVAFSHLQQEFSDLNFGLQRLATEEEFEDAGLILKIKQ